MELCPWLWETGNEGVRYLYQLQSTGTPEGVLSSLLRIRLMGGVSTLAEFSSLMKSWTFLNTSASVQLLKGGANPGPVLQAMAK